MNGLYTVKEFFKIRDSLILVLDRDFESWETNKISVDGNILDYNLNSIRNWVSVPSLMDINNRTVMFV